jgi:hypothetical protein
MACSIGELTLLWEMLGRTPTITNKELGQMP